MMVKVSEQDLWVVLYSTTVHLRLLESVAARNALCSGLKFVEPTLWQHDALLRVVCTKLCTQPRLALSGCRTRLDFRFKTC